MHEHVSPRIPPEGAPKTIANVSIIVVRTPQKLKDLLEKRNLSAEKCKDNLAIIEGNAKDPESVSKALCDEHGVLVDQVVFGIGSYLLLPRKIR